MDTGSRSVRIVLDQPRRHLGRRLWRASATLLGGLLLLIGLCASIPAIPASLAVLALVAAWAASEPWPAGDVPVGTIVFAWAVSTTLAVGGLKYGLRLLRRHRSLVLFLRRFGHDEAQDAVSFAVLETIGPSWRIVTLDDEEMIPIGVPRATRRLFHVGELGTRYLTATGYFLGVRMFPILLGAMWGVVAVAVAGPAMDLLRTGVTTVDPWMEAIEPLAPILFSALEGRPPIEAIGPTLPGFFALVVTACLFSFAALIVTGAVLILAFPLGTVLFFLSDSAEAVREAEKAKTVRAATGGEVLDASRAITERSRRVFGPRLVVLRVSSDVWRVAVRELASRASLVLIDISEPTANVLWELQELDRLNAPSVLIGDYERLAPPADGTPPARGTVIERLAPFAAGQEVLAYTADPRGLKRFARALRSRLLETTSRAASPAKPAASPDRAKRPS